MPREEPIPPARAPRIVETQEVTPTPNPISSPLMDLRIVNAGGETFSENTTWKLTVPLKLSDGGCILTARFRPLLSGHASVAIHINGELLEVVEPKVRGVDVHLTGAHASVLRPGENEVSLVFGDAGNRCIQLFHVSIQFRVDR